LKEIEKLGKEKSLSNTIMNLILGWIFKFLNSFIFILSILSKLIILFVLVHL
jgi:hypothetical protein